MAYAKGLGVDRVPITTAQLSATGTLVQGSSWLHKVWISSDESEGRWELHDASAAIANMSACASTRIAKGHVASANAGGLFLALDFGDTPRRCANGIVFAASTGTIDMTVAYAVGG